MSSFDKAIGQSQVCALCEAGEAHLGSERMSFDYGEPGKSVTLYAEVPVWTCDVCGESYTAEGSEEAEREAICVFLGRLTPAQIVGLRKKAGLTQESFAAQLGVGRVTVARWETGQQLQSAVYDRLIRELSDRRAAAASYREPPRFKTNVEHRRPAAAMFDLVPA